MENGTVIWKDDEGKLWEAQIDHVEFYPNFSSGLIGYKHKRDQTNTKSNPAPLLYTAPDGKQYHVYTHLHPQLKNMIGTKGILYDDRINDMSLRKLENVADIGFPCGVNGVTFAYFAVPITPHKTELTLQQIADKFGIDVDQLRIKE